MRQRARSDRGPAGPVCAATLILLLGAACASAPAAPTYRFFEQPDAATDPWFAKVEDWQARALQEEAAVQPEHMSIFKRRHTRIDRKLGAFVAAERHDLAREIADWARVEGRKHYRFDEDLTLEGDHWPTYGELVARNGDDCDGLDLIAYHLLIEFGFPRDQLFRAVMRRNGDRRNHMVTLWFEDPDDPWVFDATGAMTRKLVRFSQTAGWTPTAVFNERVQYSVAPRGGRGQERADR